MKCDADAVALDDFIDAIEQAQAINRPSVRAIAAEQFNTKCIVNDDILALRVARAAANIETKGPLQWLKGGCIARSRE